VALAIATAFASASAFVLINERDQKRLTSGVTTVTSGGGSAAPLPFDVTDEPAVKKAF
jgi:NADP-dependent 3-hydroxy acid dehydrogenase YdfG